MSPKTAGMQASLVMRAWGLLLACLFASTAFADVDTDVSCVPVAERGAKELGCFVLARQEVGKLSGTDVYWHLRTYPTRAAAEAAKGKDASVVESFGKVWLLAIAGASWNPVGGERVARVGPLPIARDGSYTAEFMEATFVPGMKSRVHRHPGPEAWYVVAGEQCLETPGQKAVVREGQSGIVPEGPPMILWGTGTTTRRALALILHDTSKPMTAAAADWKPAGLCAAQLPAGAPSDRNVDLKTR